MNDKNRPTGLDAFTLIELLVVIAIIAISGECANDRMMTHLGGGKGVTLQGKEWSVTWIVQMQ